MRAYNTAFYHLCILPENQRNWAITLEDVSINRFWPRLCVRLLRKAKFTGMLVA